MPDGSGRSFGALWAYYDRATSSWKMSQDSLPLTEDTPSVRSSVTWPTSGMTVNGRCYPLPMWERRTSASASGSWPTPTQIDATLKATGRVGSHGRHAVQLSHLANGGWINDDDWAKNRVWPTPNHTMGDRGPSRPDGKRGRDLADLTGPNPTIQMWPTPRATDADRGGRGDLIQGVRGNPNTHYKLWPTPTTSDASGGGNRNSKNSKAHAGVSLTDACLTGDSSTPRSEVTGQLNPTWVEWLMGFPTGWTD